MDFAKLILRSKISREESPVILNLSWQTDEKFWDDLFMF